MRITGMTFGQLAKYTSHMYKVRQCCDLDEYASYVSSFMLTRFPCYHHLYLQNLTPEEKATWDARAAQDKARYDAEISSYVPPPGHDARGVMIEDHRPRKRTKRAPKDPAAPKRASGAYVFFTNEMRAIVMKEYPGVKFVEMGRILGERWRALDQEEKKRYEDMATQDKMRFQMEMQTYTANQAAMNPQAAQVAPTYGHYPVTDHGVTYHHDPYAHHDPYGQQTHQYHQA